MGTSDRVRCLFGTDGVRDVANRGIMTPEMAMRLGRAFVLFLTERGIPRPRLALGRDTRRSGAMLEAALVAGMMSAGAQVHLLGVFPTPGVSFAVPRGQFDAGAVISASHNPAEYNGIKFLDSKGYKLGDDDEAMIEEYLGDNLLDDWRPTGASIGDLRQAVYYKELYIDWLIEQVNALGCCDWPLVVDAANGAASEFVKKIFANWSGVIRYIGVDPDGLNINEGVGVMHMEHLVSNVRDGGAYVGIAYDGDADRVLLCDSRGRLLDGDIMLWIIARYLHREGALGSGVVATVMSNMILEEKLAEHGIEVFRCPVGDRYVLEKMCETGARLGGEQSGHIIASDYVTTGDGLSTGLLFLKACKELGEDIASLVDRFPRYPQILRNLKLANRDFILSSPMLGEATDRIEKTLDGIGRILLRPSGTEPLLRILVEAKDEKLMNEICNELEQLILKIGGDTI